MAKNKGKQVWLSMVGLIAIVGLLGLIIYITMFMGERQSPVYGPPSTWTPEVRQMAIDENLAAQQFFDVAKFEEAHQAIREHLKKFPQDPEAYQILAWIYRAQKNIEKAYESSLKSLELEPKQPQMHDFAGVLAMKLNKMTEAIEHYKQAIKHDSDNPKYALYLGNAYLLINDTENAKIYALRALRLAPTSHQAYFIVSQCFAREGKPDLALEQIDKAIYHCPITDRSYLLFITRKAALQRRVNQPGMALDTLMQLPDAALATTKITQEIALCYLMMNKPLDAAKVWKLVFEDNPQNAEAAAAIGSCYLKAGDLLQAKQWLAIGLGIKPDHRHVQGLMKALEGK